MDTPKGAITIARTTMFRQQMPDYNGPTIDVRQ